MPQNVKEVQYMSKQLLSVSFVLWKSFNLNINPTTKKTLKALGKKKRNMKDSAAKYL